MIELTTRGNVAVLRMNHGKANAMDLEFCEALTAQFNDLRQSSPRAVVITGSGRMFSAGVDLLRRGRGAATARSFCRCQPGARSAVLIAQAGRRGGQRTCDCRGLRDGVRRRLPDDGARARTDRHPGTARRRAVSRRPSRDHALRRAASAPAVAHLPRHHADGG